VLSSNGVPTLPVFVVNPEEGPLRRLAKSGSSEKLSNDKSGEIVGPVDDQFVDGLYIAS
jgi:hypothetical protein